MAQTVVGIFESSSKAQEAVRELVEQGFSRDRIDVSSNNTGSSYSNTGSSYSSTTDRNDDDNESGISKFFKNLFGGDDDDADKYTKVASHAQSVVTVHAQSEDEAERAADILDDYDAVDVDEHASRLGYSRAGSGSDFSGSTNSAITDTTAGLAGVTGAGLAGAAGYAGTGTGSDYSGTTGSDFTNDTTNDETKKINVIEENLEVGKREVTRGGVRVRSRIIERPVEETVRLREENVNVERNTVNRPATEADFRNFEEKEIELVERAEVPVVNKEARVVEEVSLTKDVEERSETVRDTVRKTEVDVENVENRESRTDYNSNNSSL